MVASVNFREQVRRTQTMSKTMGNNPFNDASNGSANERTRLLTSLSNHGDANGSGPASAGSDGSAASTRDFFLNYHHTPGRDSNNPLIRYPASTWHITKVTLMSNYVNWLLLMVPIGIAAGALGWNSTAVFTINFFAIIPLAAVLSFATEEISAKLGESLGGLLNATFGNAVELIVSIVALRDGQIEVVQSSMLGSILSNMLLVLGMCFLFGGIRNMNDRAGLGTEQSFASATAQTTCSLMALSSASLVIPSALYAILDGKSNADERSHSILTLSRGTSVILLILYVLYLVFQLRTHKNLFDAEAAPVVATNGEAEAAAEEEEEGPMMGPWSALGVLVVTTILVAICADYLVGSIDDLVETAHISKAFIGLILIPIVGNAAEHVTAVVVAVRNKMDLAMGVAIGSSIQIALLVTPFLVMVGWAIGQPMSLHFESFETTAFAISVIVVTYTVQDGKSNYLEGAMLLGLYFIIALAFFATPAAVFDKTANLLSLH
jgi:Ca2+:H+ antiporter